MISDQHSPVVFIVANSYWNLFNFREGLIKALLKEGFQVSALAIPDEHQGLVAALGCSIYPLYFEAQGLNPFKDLKLLLQLRRALQKYQPSCCLFFTAKPNVYGSLSASLTGVPYINNISGLGSVFIKQGLMSKIMGVLYKFALVRAHRVFFQNKDDQSLFIDKHYVKLAQTQVLPGSGVDLERFKPTASANTNDSTSFSFNLLGRLLRDKGVYEYIEAAHIVYALYPNVTFKLLGFLGVNNPTAISKAQMDTWLKHSHIQYLGPAHDVRPFIQDSDCVVLPSYREGTPRTLLEAAAMGKPIITTRVPGCQEVVEDGHTGYLCTPKDPHDLAQKMIQMLSLTPEQRLNMGLKGREKMEQTYNQAFVIQAYLDQIKSILAHRQ